MLFTDVLSSNGVKYQRGAGKGEIRICCLYCSERGESEDTRFRLGINYITKKAQCFNCHWSSRNAVSLILKKLVNGSIAVEESTENVEEDDPTTVVLPEGFEYLDPTKSTNSWYHKKALQYLRDRDIPDWQITAKKMGVTIVGNFKYRIIFPVVMERELVGLVGRDFTKQSKVKYLNNVGEKHLYNCPMERKKIKKIVLSEGIFKALKIERVAMLPSAALLGHSVTGIHLKQLARYPNLSKVIVWPDPDRVGLTGAAEVCKKLQDEGYRAYTIMPLPKAQADELPDRAVRKAIEMATPYTAGTGSKMRLEAAFS